MLANLEALKNTGFDLALMLDFLGDGKYTTRNATIRYARTALMCSDELPNIFRCCLKPPRWSASAKKKRATGGRKGLAPVAVDLVPRGHAQGDGCLGLWTRFLGGVLPSYHGHHHLSAHVRNNWSNNRLQKTFSIYFKFKGLTAKGFDVLHALGLVMSHSWISKAIRRMSRMTLDELRELVQKYPWVLTYDNVVILFKIFSQRLENLQKLTSGTAATAYLKPGATPLPASANQDLKEQRAANLDSPITIRRVLDLAAVGNKKLRPYYAWLLLAALIHSPDFDLSTYKFKDHTLLQKPPPLNPLPIGKDAKSMQFLLSSLHMYGKQWVESIGREKVIAFIGDQLTVSRLRGLFLRRAGDDSSFERLDFLLPIFGWFHVAMQAANSLHAQYLGRAKGHGFLASFTLLGRKGLHKTSTEGPFHAHLNEAIHHVGEAEFREIWRTVAAQSKTTVEGLRSKTPSELVDLATRALSHHASSEALETMRRRPDRDEVQEFHTQFTRDLLPYLTLVAAIKSGDVGSLEALLPTFLFRFIGGGNNNYQEEALELLNGLNVDWPQNVALHSSDFVRQNCWLLTFTDNADNFVSFDQAQEHNIKDIKVTYKPPGPRGGWDYMRILHPAIPTIRTNAEFIDQEFNTLTRGKKHTSPSKEKDIQALLGRLEDVHEFKPGRKLDEEDKPEDYIAAGGQTWIFGETRENWRKKRNFKRSTEERAMGGDAASDVSQDSEHSDEQIEE
ncbi:hypothetical protein R3P38DRAFT_3609227 [Favolaschia claudopus]|uniref:DUF6589 domain-containing protein n=1 Tax=Favolaschia claudopus TaxID=2862362 RepID=A0AAW0A7U7_9AGAR